MLVASALACLGWSLVEISQNERKAFSRLPGCEAAPPDPYSEAFMDSLPWPPPRPTMSELDAENEATGQLEPGEVIQLWRRAVLGEPRACADLLLVSVYNGDIVAAACNNVSASTLSAYYEFKFVLAVALSDVVPKARRAANSIFLLDLGSRADAPVPRRMGQVGLTPDETAWTLPRLASSGGCASRLPVPISLPGFGSETWQAILREPVVGGGAYWRWPDVKWDDKRAETHFEGRDAHDFGPCEEVTLQPTNAKCASPAGACTSPADTANAGACRSESSCQAMRHPHAILKELVGGRLSGNRRRATLQLRANFSSGKDPPPSWISKVVFSRLADSKALLELDAIGRQSLLLAKLTLNSVVLTQSSSFPLWFEPLLTNESVVRVRSDLSDLPRRLRWLAAHDGEARAIAETGRRQACALLHLPHVAGYLGRLLQRYARIFDKPNTVKLHREVRHVVTPYGGAEKAQKRRKANPFDAAERLWTVKLDGVSGRLDCSAWWIGEYRCHELRQLHRERKKVKRRSSAPLAALNGDVHKVP